MAEEDQRSRGILTPVDREYLLGNKKYQSDQQEINRRSSIRQRVRDSILDFSILLEYLSNRDRKQIFSEMAGNMHYSTNRTSMELRYRSHIGDTNLEKGIIDGLAFFYLGCIDAGIDFDEIVEKGLMRTGNNMIVSVSIQQPDDLVDSAAKKLLDNEPLSSEEVQAVTQRLGKDSTEIESDAFTDSASEDENGP